MASVSAIRNGIEARLETISGLRVGETVDGQVNPPAAIVRPGGPKVNAVEFDATMGRGSDNFHFTILVLVSAAHERVAHDALDAYLDGSGVKSIRKAIDDEDTLGGVVHFTRVVAVPEYGVIRYGGQEYLGAELLVEATAGG